MAPGPAHSHCPAHDTTDTPRLTAAKGDCPALDSARPTQVAREDGGVTTLAVYAQVTGAGLATKHRALQHQRTAAPPHLINSPLRI